MSNKIIVGVLASIAGGYDSMVRACRETCYSKSAIPEDVSVFYIYGASPLRDTPDYETISPGTCALLEGDCFYHNYPETRENIIHKTIAFFEYCVNNLEFDYIYRPNCGSYINLDILCKIANTLSNKELYFGKKSLNKKLPAYASGSGFMISRDLVEKIVLNKNRIIYPHHGHRFVMDDVSIGAMLTEIFNVDITDAPRIDTNYEAIKSENFVFDPTCHHYYFQHTIDPRCLYEIHKYFLNHNSTLPTGEQ